MAEINLLAAPIILPPTSEANSASTSLVPTSRIPAVNQAIARSDTAYPSDSYVWSVSPGNDGSYLFYAVPLKDSPNDSPSGQQNYFLSAHPFSSDRHSPSMSNAAAQYRLYASIPMPMYGHLLNVYA